MPDQTPDQLREHAAEIMLDHARDVERLSIREHLDDHGLDDHDSAAVNTIQELISTATITIDWPSSPVQAMDVGADDQLATVTRERDEALQDVQSLTDDLSAVRTERDQIDAELATERREHGITDTAAKRQCDALCRDIEADRDWLNALVEKIRDHVGDHGDGEIDVWSLRELLSHKPDQDHTNCTPDLCAVVTAPVPGVEIPLTRGLVALVDQADYEAVTAIGSWCASPSYDGLRTYAKRSMRKPDGSKTTQFLHTFITGWPYVDHINGDGLDNRRVNLRPATVAQNNRNTRLSRNNASGFKGVHWVTKRSCWRACISVNGKNRHVGHFATAEEAARAYDAAARQHFGEYARLNFPTVDSTTGSPVPSRRAQEPSERERVANELRAIVNDSQRMRQWEGDYAVLDRDPTSMVLSAVAEWLDREPASEPAAPKLATGGIIRSNKLAMVGEQSDGCVIPAERPIDLDDRAPRPGDHRG